MTLTKCGVPSAHRSCLWLCTASCCSWGSWTIATEHWLHFAVHALSGIMTESWIARQHDQNKLLFKYIMYNCYSLICLSIATCTSFYFNFHPFIMIQHHIFFNLVNQSSLPTPFYSVLVSVSVFMALPTVFQSMNSPTTPFSHSVLSVLFLPHRSIQLYISIKVFFFVKRYALFLLFLYGSCLAARRS